MGVGGNVGLDLMMGLDQGRVFGGCCREGRGMGPSKKRKKEMKWRKKKKRERKGIGKTGGMQVL